MVVYGEYLFLENLIVGFLILKLTALICGLTATKWAYVLGSVACGLYSFIIFARLSCIGEMLSRVMFAVLLLPLVFGLKGIVKQLAAFYITSFVMGGVTFAVICLAGSRGFIGRGYIYANEITYGTIALGVSAGLFMLIIFVKMVKKDKEDKLLYRELILRIGEYESSLRGYIDTGNHLCDEITGAPVFIISKTAAEKVTAEINNDEMTKRYCVIPFTAAGTSCGIMEGFRADMLIVMAENTYVGSNISDCMTVKYAPAIFGIYNGDFKARGGTSGFDVLLNGEVMERGII